MHFGGINERFNRSHRFFFFFLEFLHRFRPFVHVLSIAFILDVQVYVRPCNVNKKFEHYCDIEFLNRKGST